MISSLDPRVKLTNPVAGYSSFVTRAQFPEPDLGDSEQTPSDLAGGRRLHAHDGVDGATAHPAHLQRKGQLLFPRGLRGRPAGARGHAGVRPLRHAGDKLRYHLNFDDGHNYGEDNREALYRMIGDFFYPGDQKFRRSEIPVARKSARSRNWPWKCPRKRPICTSWRSR